jgi:plasmid maintenance system antidote protein VapI
MRMQSNYDIAKTRSREKEIKGIRRFHHPDAPPSNAECFV